MKNINILKYIIAGGLLWLGVSSCEDQLDTKIVNQYGDEYTWTRANKAQGILLNAYNNIGTQVNSYNNDFLDAATDNALTQVYNSSVGYLATGGISSTSFAVGNWGTAYNQFRNVNLFLENGLDEDIVYFYYYNSDDHAADSIQDQELRDRYRGEAHFLRAWWGMELLRMYGGKTEDGQALGYPIITQALTNDDKDAMLSLARDTYEDCILQIIEDCDSAISLLPNRYSGSDAVTGLTQTGRASGQAAYALRSRAATYAASPAYQSDDATAETIKSRWERAAIFSREAIDNAALGGFAALTNANLVGSTLTSTPAEFLFRKFHNNNSIETQNLPPYFYGAARTNPSQNLVDAFFASNGYPITDPLSNYDPQDPFVNREKRLALCVLYNGQAVQSGSRSLEVADSIYYTAVDSFYFEEDIPAYAQGKTTRKDVTPAEEVVIGEDTVMITEKFYYSEDLVREGLDAPGALYQNTRTGYYLRKFVSTKKNILFNNNNASEKQNDYHMNPLLRRAEVYFNLAEALNEAVGPNATLAGAGGQTAKDILGDIRMKNMSLFVDDYLDAQSNNADDFRTLIQLERRLEFAFENHRYFDLRRWLLPLNEPVRGMRLTQKPTGEYVYSGTDPNMDNSKFIIEDRPFTEDKYYYGPIPYDELIKSPNMVNNLGW